MKAIFSCLSTALHRFEHINLFWWLENTARCCWDLIRLVQKYLYGSVFSLLELIIDILIILLGVRIPSRWVTWIIEISIYLDKWVRDKSHRLINGSLGKTSFESFNWRHYCLRLCMLSRILLPFPFFFLLPLLVPSTNGRKVFNFSVVPGEIIREWETGITRNGGE